MRRCAILAVLLLFCIVNPAFAQVSRQPQAPTKIGPATAALVDGEAVLNVPPGIEYYDAVDAAKLMGENLDTDQIETVGVLIRRGADGVPIWALILGYNDCGYIKDDDAQQLDNEAILDTLKESDDGNKYGMQVIGWNVPPSYDVSKHALTWSVRVRDPAGSRNALMANVSMLGRSGVLMGFGFITEENSAQVPEMMGVLSNNMKFAPGKDYASWTPGDGEGGSMAGLIAGGGVVAVAAKFGILALLKKGLFLLIIPAVAILRKLFGRKQERMPTS